MEYRTGARSLRGIFEEMVEPMLYMVPDNPDIRTVTIKSLFSDPIIARGPPVPRGQASEGRTA